MNSFNVQQKIFDKGSLESTGYLPLRTDRSQYQQISAIKIYLSKCNWYMWRLAHSRSQYVLFK